MQKVMMPDYLDGSKRLKDELTEIRFLSALALVKNAITDRTNNNFVVNKKLLQDTYNDFPEKKADLFKLLKKELDDSALYELLVDILQTNDTMRVFVTTYQDYCHGPRNYIFSTYLTEILSNTKADVSESYLRKPFQGYLELPGLKDENGENVLGLFVSMVNHENKWNLRISSFLNTLKYLHVGHLNICLENEDLISDCIKKYPKTEYRKDKIIQGSSTYSLYIMTVINALLYILNIDEETLETYNDFATKKSKRAAQETIYTTKPFLLLDFEKNAAQNSEKVFSTFVKGHFRWQPYGTQKSKIKLIYIKPTVRNYTTGSFR